MTTTQTEAQRYELMVVLKADRRDEEITKHLDSIKKHVEDHGGKFFHEDDWGKREMTYKIKGQELGYYVVLGVETEPKHIKELNDLLRIDQSLLRYLLQKMPKGYELTKTIEADLDFSKKRKDEEEEKKEEEKPVKEEKPEVVEEVEEEEVVEETPEEEPEVEEEEAPAEEEAEETPEEEPEVVEEVEEEEVVEETPEEEPEVEEEKEEEPAEEEAKEEEAKEEESPAEEEKEEEPKKEEKKKEEKPKKKAEDDTIDDLDKKLQAIMNDTDIDISL